MAEILVLNRDSWMDALRLQEIDAYKEKSADDYVVRRNEKVALTQTQITKILKPMNAENRAEWTTRHNEVLAMTQQDIETEREIRRQKFVVVYNSRQKKGDIIEVQEDGRYTTTGTWDKKNFDLLVIPGLSVKDAKKKYTGSLVEDGIEKAKFKYNIALSVDAEQKQVLTKIQADEQVSAKTSISIG